MKLARSLAAAGLIAAASACQSIAPSQMTGIAEAYANREAWDGKIVRLRGRVEGCEGALYMCSLVSTADPDDRLVVEYVPRLEPRLGAAAGREVVLTARITSECAVNICTDRGPDIIPVNILEVD